MCRLLYRSSVHTEKSQYYSGASRTTYRTLLVDNVLHTICLNVNVYIFPIAQQSFFILFYEPAVGVGRLRHHFLCDYWKQSKFKEKTSHYFLAEHYHKPRRALKCPLYKWGKKRRAENEFATGVSFPTEV